MTRLAHRTAHAALLTANGVCLAVLAPDAARTQPGTSLLEVVGAAVLCYVGTVALVHTCGLAWHLGRADACRWRHRTQPTPARRTVPRAPVEQQHAAAMAAVAAEPMQPQTSVYDTWMAGVPTDGTPALPPLGPTPMEQPQMPTAVMPTVQTAPTWGFGPRGVVEPEPQLWTAPVSMGARHAGRAA
jgi:hypothetical protein